MGNTSSGSISTLSSQIQTFNNNKADRTLSNVTSLSDAIKTLLGNDYAKKDLSNTTSPIGSAPYLKTTYTDGTSGYNIWSNGYCEQWGELQTAGYGRTSTVNLLKTFANINYQVLLSWTYETTQGDHGSTAAYRGGTKGTKSVGSFIIYSCFENYQPIVTWRVMGYLASGQY